MPDHKNGTALKLNESDMEIVLIGRKDSSVDAECRSRRVQLMVGKMIDLGQKRGRPSQKEEKELDEAA